MPAMTISITDRQREFVEAEVHTGGYGNASEVIREALRLLEFQKREREARLRDIRAAIDEGDRSGEPLALDPLEAFLTAAHQRQRSRRGQQDVRE
jgi:antitoxin ParD1/3/4